MVALIALLWSFLWLGSTAAYGQPWGLSNRVGNSTLRLPPNPPATSYITTNAFGDLRFENPIIIVVPPGETNRLFVIEQRGRIAVVTNLSAPSRTVFLDLSGSVAGGVPQDERGLLGLAFHPGYATNRYFFAYYSTTANTAAGERTNGYRALKYGPTIRMRG